MTNLLNDKQRSPTALFKIAALTLLLAALLMGINNAQAQAPEVSFPTATATVVEGGQVGVNVAFTSSPLAARIFVNIRVEGSATPDGDFRTNNSSANIAGSIITINAGRTSPTAFFILTMLDELEEVPETITLTLLPHTSNGPSYTVGTNNTYTLTITDVAPPPPPVASVPLTVVLAVDSATITDRDFVVTVTTSKALAPFSTDDFSIPNGQVQAFGERIDHPDGTASYPLQIRAVSPGIVEVTMMEGFFGPSDGIGPRSTVSNTLFVIYTPQDTTPPMVTLTGAPSEVTSLAAFAVTATFDEDVTGFDAIADITVTNGTAAVPAAISNSKTTYTLTITPDGNGAIGITIPAAAAIDDANNGNMISDTVTVAYATDTTPPVASVHIGTAGTQVGTIAEAGTTSTTVTVALNPAPTTAVTVNLTRSSTATIATDYSQTGLTDSTDPAYSIMVAAGATTASFMLTAVDDSVNDDAEAAVFTVTTGTGYTVAAGGAAVVTVTITDNDAPPVASIHIGTAGTQTGTIAETGTTSTTVTVSLSTAANTEGVVVSLTRSGMATIATDYSQTGLTAATDPAYSIMVAAGATTASFTLTAVRDTENDAAETAVFTVTTGTGYSTATGGAEAVTISITDDADPPGQVGDLAATPSNGQVTLSWFNSLSADISTVIISAMITGGAVVDINGADAGNDLSISTTPGSRRDSQTITGLSNGTGYTFSLVASDGTNPSTPVTTTATPVVLPEFSFPTATATGAEGAGTIAVQLAFTGVASIASNVFLNVSLGGTAMATDYSTANSTVDVNFGNQLFLFIGVGRTSPVNFNISPAIDALTEGDETLIITLLPSDDGTYTLGANNTYTLTITDPPPPPVASIHIGTAGTQTDTIAEAGTTSTMVTVSLSAPAPTGGVVVSLTRSGMATIATDYSQTGLTDSTDPAYSIMVAAGATTASFMLTAVRDTENDAAETAVFTVTTGTGYTPATGGAEAVTISITDDADPPGPVADLVATPGNGQVTVSWFNSLSADISTVIISAMTTGGAVVDINGADAGNDLSISTTPGSRRDSQTITGLSNGTGYTFSLVASDGTNPSTPVTITATPVVLPEFSFQTATATGAEGAGTITVNIAFTGVASLASNAFLQVSLGGTAEAADYSTGNSTVDVNFGNLPFLFIEAGRTSPVSFTITPTTDALTEGDETLIITLLLNTNGTYTLGDNNTYTLTITDPPPVASIHIGNAGTQTGTIAEAGTTSTMVTVSLSAAAPTGGVVVSLTRSGMATIATDYSQTGLTDSTDPAYSIMVAAGATTASFMLTAVADTETDPAETAVFTVMPGTGYTVAAGGAAAATVTILDDSDTTPPLVTLTGPDPATFSSTDAFVVTATFSEAVTGFDEVADITVTNGTATPVAVSNSETTYTLNITPDGSNLGIEIFIPADAAMDEADNGNTVSNTVTVAYTDTTPPTVELTGPDPATFSSTDAFVVTATFSEAVTGFDAVTDIMVTNGAATAPVAVSNSETTYTLNITPAAGTGDIEISIPASAAADAANNPNTASEPFTVAYAAPADTTPPTVMLTSATTTVINRTPFTVTATFSEDVTGFDSAADITVINGIVGRFDSARIPPVSVDGSAKIYTLTISATGNGDVSISIPANVAMDGAGNGNTASAVFTVPFTGVDVTGPRGVLTPSPDSSIGGERRGFVRNSNAVFEVTATFDEAVSGFGLDDIIIQSGTTSNFMGMDEGTVYTFDVTPSGTGTVQVGINTGITDLLGNVSSEGSNILAVLYDATPPTVALSDYPATANASTTTFAVTAEFSEVVTGFNADDITVTNGAVTVSGSGPIYTLTITPDGNDGPITIAIAASVVTDVAGNANTASTNADSTTPSDPVSVTYDGTPPTVTLSGVPATVNVRDPFAVTATFSEAVTGFDEIADIAVTGGTAMAPVAMGNSGTTYTLTITPADTDGTITIEIPAAAATDTTGNGNEASTSPVSVTSDTTPPTVTLTVPNPATFSNTEAFVVTATFSEAVTGFDAVTDITVTNGTAMVPVATNAMTYTLTITPAAGTGDIEISIPAGAAMDEATNPNTASETLTVTYAADTTPLTVTLATPAQTANDATAFNVTITFSEDVTGFVLDDIVFNNARALTALRMTNASTYVVPVQADNMADVTITVPAGVAMAGTKTNLVSNTLMVPYDHAPTVVLAAAATSMTSPFTVTATFSESVSGFDVDDIMIDNGTVATVPAPVAMPDGTAAYTLTITPTAAGDVTLSIPAGGANDLDGQATANTASNTLTVAYTLPDTTAPTVALTDYPDAVNGPFAVTATFSESVTGLEATEIDISTNATVTIAGSGTTYTLTITPTTDGTITITIPADVAENDANNGNTASSEVSVTYDATPPTATFSGAPASHDGMTPFMVTVTLSEPSSNFVEDDTSPTNAERTLSGSGTDYILTITPLNNNPIGIGIFADRFTDAAGNGNAFTNATPIPYAAPADDTPPTVTFTAPPANHDGTSEFMVTVTLSEPATDFIAGDISISSNATGTLTGSGTDYTLTVTPTDNNAITIDIAAGTFTDAATNGNTASETLTVTYAVPDTTPPTVARPVAQFSIVEQTTSFEVTVTFSEAVTGFDAATDIMVTRGTTLAPVAMGDSGTIYTLAITPDGPSGQIVITIPAGVAMDASGNLNTASPTLSVTYIRPVTVVLSLADPQLISNGRDPFAVTATFSEPVNFIMGDVMVANGTFTASGNGAVYTLTITPTGDTNDAITIQLLEGAGEVGGSGQILPRDSDASEVLQVMVLLDNTPPTVELTGPATFSGETFAVTAEFSEVVTGLTADEITITGASVTISGEGTTYTLTIVPDGTNGDIEITIPADVARDDATNMNTVSNELTVRYDNTPLTVTFTDPPANHSNSEFMVTVTLSEPATGFVVGDIDFSANATGTLTGSGTVYTLTVTPTDTSSITIDIAAGSFTDAAGSPNTASDTLTVTYAAPADTTPPTVMLSAPDAVNNRDPFTVTATFSEPVTGFDATDVDVTHGDLIEITPVTALVSSSLARATLTRQLNASTTGHSFAQIYTLTIMPAGTGDITITINADGVMDAAGNGNTASTNAAGNTAPVSVTYDAAPTVTLTGPDPATFSSTDAFVVTATFSENVTGFDAVADITVNNGTAAVPVAVDNSETTYTLTITPDGTNGDIEIFIPAAAAMDNADNPNTISNTVTVAYTASADTKAAITGFMLDRANKLASNQPGLARFLQGTDCGTFSANSTDVSGSVDGCLSNGHTWGEISRTWSSDNAYTLATVGLHGLMRDDLIIGGLVQFDKADDDKRNITGQGWLVGPYFVRKPTDQNMTFEGRLLYGQTDNDISPLGSYTDSFDTERYLAQLRVTGEYGYRIATMMPSLDLTYTEDTQQAYTDTPSNLIGEQGVDLTQLTFGMDFKLPVAIQTGQLDLTGGLSGTYSETNGGESDVEGGRGRTELGLNYSRGSGTTLRLGTFYDGISSDHESFGVNFSLDMKF